MKKDYSKAITDAEAQGVDFSKDFFQQNVGGLCADLAHTYGYKKPKNANGSTGRYFFERMRRDRNNAVRYLAEVFEGATPVDLRRNKVLRETILENANEGFPWDKILLGISI